MRSHMAARAQLDAAPSDLPIGSDLERNTLYPFCSYKTMPQNKRAPSRMARRPAYRTPTCLLGKFRYPRDTELGARLCRSIEYPLNSRMIMNLPSIAIIAQACSEKKPHHNNLRSPPCRPSRAKVDMKKRR